LEKIETLTETVKSSTTSVENLAQSSEEIGKILKVINDIANQTNLLALNAAIEAARAGVHGESFSVVASQVRALAGDTRDATQQISSIIETIQTEIKAAVQTMRLSFKEVGEGLELTNKTNEALSRINDESAALLQKVHQMAELSEKQNMSSANVAQGVSEIADASSATAQNITEIASSTARLNEVTDNLRELTSKFKFDSDEVQNNGYQPRNNHIEHQNARAF
ncbi:MAG TPA: methyl-accepting chemotaxis protein, partial [Pyrinomonadaceae bacterium]|nr:methyl-accepting chemotaxis protein [Pyrinomonadaceae bacterium]